MSDVCERFTQDRKGFSCRDLSVSRLMRLLANENIPLSLLQADETLAAFVDPEGVRGYIEIKKDTLEFSIFYRGIAH
ncbi:hypothetical protein [Methanosarcina acetivorans]|uniref:hypothetical protein n=1 Tax=Methanosarcina acetivorans TaxID=2214 RepID=UPI00138A09AD|nr:hypothetical protein [Methanosarcina acetivorans]